MSDDVRDRGKTAEVLHSLRQDYDRLAVSTKRRKHTTHHADCGCFTDAADALVTSLDEQRLHLAARLWHAEEFILQHQLWEAFTAELAERADAGALGPDVTATVTHAR